MKGRLAAASAVGTTLEWYDFTVYNVMAALVFNAVFFPAFDPMAGTLLAFSTYAAGYLSRPFGGIVFGSLGDRRGRRTVLVATLLVMGVATGLMALLPGYHTLGAWAPLLLVVLRFVQGAAIGGEWAGAVLLTIEHGAPDQRGRNGSFAQLGPACGTLLGTGVVAAVSAALPPSQFEAWGWRAPFALSLALVGFGLWLRRGVAETPAFVELERTGALARAPVVEVLRRHRRPLLVAIGVRVGPDIFYALLVVFSLTYITTVLGESRTLALTATMIAAACNALAIGFFGALSDRIGRRRVVLIATVLAIGWAFAFFPLVDTRAPAAIVIAVSGGMLVHAALYGPQAALIAEQFPAEVRYAGSSLAYTLTGLVAGGFAPLIYGALYRATGATPVLSLYATVALVISIVALRFVR